MLVGYSMLTSVTALNGKICSRRHHGRGAPAISDVSLSPRSGGPVLCVDVVDVVGVIVVVYVAV